MKVLVDTNVILDDLMGRKEYFHNADKIIKLCADKKNRRYFGSTYHS